MKKHLLFCLLAFISPLMAQPPSPESILAELPKAKNDTARFTLLIQACQTYWSSNPPKGIELAKRAMTIAEKMKWTEGMGTANGVLGMNYVIISDYNNGQQYLKKSVQLSEEAKDYNGMSKALGALGNIAYFQSRFPEALEYFIRSLKVSEKLNNKTEMAATLSNIGSIYMDLEKYPEALVYFEKAVKLNLETKMDIYLIANYSNIGAAFSRMKNNGKALEYHFKAFEIAKKIDEQPSIANAYLNIGGIMNDSGLIAQAIAYGNKALQLNRLLGNVSGTGASHKLLGSSYLKLAKASGPLSLTVTEHNGISKTINLAFARRHADSSVMIFEQLNSLDNLKDAYKLLSEVQELEGDMAGALISFQKYAAAKDSVFNMEEDKKLTQTAMQYEFDKKEAAAQVEQEKKDTRQRNIRYSILAGLAGVSIFLIVVYRQRNKIAKEKQRSEELLLNILPEEVAAELKEKGEADARLIDEVTVLFTDFKGFTAMSEKLSAKELVRDLHECFTAFDKIMEKHRMEKIKTIGDSYMAAGGLPTVNNSHASDAVKAALDIRQFIEDGKANKTAKGLPYFEIRIGVHTGAVVAGIVGVKKFSYDIWGDTVNTASRMESSGEPGKVNISETTYLLVKDLFDCTYRGKVAAKGKGEIDMYFAEAKATNSETTIKVSF